MDSARKRIVFGMLTALLVLAAAFGIAEVAVRLLELRPERLDFPRYLGRAADGTWVEHGTWARGLIKRPSPWPEVEMGEYVPGARFKIVYPSNPRGYFDAEGAVHATINDLGLRGAPAAKEKKAGTFRILGIGDSFTFGVGVRDSDTWLALLQEDLNGRRSGGDPVFEVLNAGVGGYNTGDEALYLERRWQGLDPDLVIVGFYLNDAYNETTFLAPEELQANEPGGLARLSRLWDLLQYRWWRFRLQRRVERFYRSSYFGDARGFLASPGGDGKVVDWSVSRASLERIVALGRERGFAVALVLFPSLYGLDGDYPFEELHAVVMEACRDMGLPALDLLRSLRGRKAGELWVHPRDHHPNEDGHRLISREVSRFLREHGALLTSAAP